MVAVAPQERDQVQIAAQNVNIPVPLDMEECVAVVHREETVEAVRAIPRERVQQQTAERTAPQPREENVPDSPEEAVEVLRLAPHEREQQQTAEHVVDKPTPQSMEEIGEVVKIVPQDRKDL